MYGKASGRALWSAWMLLRVQGPCGGEGWQGSTGGCRVIVHCTCMHKAVVGSQGGLAKFGERHVHDHMHGQAVDCCQSGSLDWCQGLCRCRYVHGLSEWFKDSTSSFLGQCDCVHGQAVDGGRVSIGHVHSFCWCWGQLFGLTYIMWCSCFQAAEVILCGRWVDDWFVGFQAAEMVSCSQWVDDRIPGGGSIRSLHGMCGISVCPVRHGCFMPVGTIGSHGVGEWVLHPLFCVEKAIGSLFGGLWMCVHSFSWLSAHVHSCIGAVAAGFACSFIQGCVHAVS